MCPFSQIASQIANWSLLIGTRVHYITLIKYWSFMKSTVCMLWRVKIYPKTDIQEKGRMTEYSRLLFISQDFMTKNCCAYTSICSFTETNRANAICLHTLHPKVLVSFPVMAVVSGLTLQRDSSLQHYRPDRTTHCDLQLLLLQGHLDHNHSWTLSSRLSISASLSLLPSQYMLQVCCLSTLL